MKRIHKKDYEKYLTTIFPKLKNRSINWGCWYNQFSFYENCWLCYFNKIFLCNFKKNKVSLVLWESSPGGFPFPHQNYLFDPSVWKDLVGRSDTYLKNVAKLLGIEINGMTKEEVLIEISKKGILIIDIFPTHGVSLFKGRQNLYCSGNNQPTVFEEYSIPKIKTIVSKIKGKVDVNMVFCSKEVFNFVGSKNRMLKMAFASSSPLPRIKRI